MRKGISTATILVTVALTLVVIFTMTIFTGQQREKTEKTVFGKLWDKFFPSKIETVIIPGTAVGAGCAVIEVTDANLLAQATWECWDKGKHPDYGGRNIPCCYVIDPKKVKGAIYKSDLDDALKKRRPDVADEYIWKIGTERVGIYNVTQKFTICYNYPDYTLGLGDEQVVLTYNPTDDCG